MDDSNSSDNDGSSLESCVVKKEYINPMLIDSDIECIDLSDDDDSEIGEKTATTTTTSSLYSASIDSESSSDSEPVLKRSRKHVDYSETIKRTRPGDETSTPKKNTGSKCRVCGQNFDDILDYFPPDSASTEAKNLKNPELTIPDLEEQHFLLNDFTIYDSNHHLVCLSLESLRQMKGKFFFSGEVSKVGDYKSEGVMTISNKIYAHYINHSLGFQIILETQVGDERVLYSLIDPSSVYKAIFSEYRREALFGHIIIKKIESAFNDENQLEFEELVEEIAELTDWEGFKIDPVYSVDDFTNYASLVADHLVSYHNAEVDDDDNLSFTDIPAARHILEQAGYRDFSGKKVESGGRPKDRKTKEPVKEEHQPLFATELVSRLFEDIFKEEILINPEPEEEARRRSVDSSEDGETSILTVKPGPSLMVSNGKVYYQFAELMDEDGDLKYTVYPSSYIQFVLKGVTAVGQVIDIFKKNKVIWVHTQVLEGDNTLLGNTRNSKELFKIKMCDVFEMNLITKIVDVHHRTGKDGLNLSREGVYWRYIHDPVFGRFEYPNNEEINATCYCKSASDLGLPDLLTLRLGGLHLEIGDLIIKINDFIYLEDTARKLLNLEYFYGDAVELPAVVYRPKSVYPRKKNTFYPFIIVQLRAIGKDRVQICVLYRPENTKMSHEESRQKPISELYVSTEEIWIEKSKLREILIFSCQPIVVYGSDQERLASWTYRDQNRFFVTSKYNNRTGKISKLTESEASKKKIPLVFPDPEPTPFKPLRTLDIFAGAGGLSKGLEESGAVKCLWGIEANEAAARAFEKNHAECKIFINDCNLLLKEMVENSGSSVTRDLPKPGDVDCIVGGPPCQGFSVLNKYCHNQHSKMKNSQVTTFLSYVDFYKPRFVLLENVRNLASKDGGLFLTLILSTLVRLGYQVAFSSLQAGHYGVAQTRRRLIVIGAGPGETLPMFPEPRHVFPGDFYDEITINNTKFSSSFTTPGAPRRTITTWDIISDLPAISSGHSEVRSEYPANAQQSYIVKHYFRKKAKGLTEHISKPLSELNQLRVNLIPTLAGSDWRDIPNKKTFLPSGQIIQPLLFPYEKSYFNEKTKKKERLPGVCACIKGTKYPCNPDDQQKDKIVPWFLHHSAHKRPGSWSGTFGRIPWAGTFKTTLTSPEPTGTQGQVLHPDQNRICSVREFARSQGFRDTFTLHGKIGDKHKQIGNAVPPPMGKAIGDELAKCLQI